MVMTTSWACLACYLGPLPLAGNFLTPPMCPVCLRPMAKFSYVYDCGDFRVRVVTEWL
jgi:hypothetical protein